MIASAITQGIGSIFGRAKSKGDDFYTSKDKTKKSAAADGNPQANYETRRDSGVPLSGDEVAQGMQFAEANGRTFNASTGYSRSPYNAKLKEPNDGAGSNDFNEVQHSKFVPADVRAISERGGPRTPKEAKRMARFDSSSAGRRIAGEAPAPGADRTPHVSGEGKRAPHQSADQLTNSRGQMSEKAITSRYRPMDKKEASEYSANLGKAWGNKLDQNDRETGNVSAEQQAKNAGVSLEERNAKVAAGAAKMNTYRAKLGAPQQPAPAGAPSGKVDANGTPEFEFVEGNKDGTASRYTGASANVAEADGRPVTTPKPPVQADDAPVASTSKKKKFNAKLG